MLDRKAFDALVDEIQTQGYDEETAAHYAALIGDTPCAAEDGRIVITEDGKEIARLKPLKFFALDR
jgi:hypothetical protein